MDVSFWLSSEQVSSSVYSARRFQVLNTSRVGTFVVLLLLFLYPGKWVEQLHCEQLGFNITRSSRSNRGWIPQLPETKQYPGIGFRQICANPPLSRQTPWIPVAIQSRHFNHGHHWGPFVPRRKSQGSIMPFRCWFSLCGFWAQPPLQWNLQFWRYREN